MNSQEFAIRPADLRLVWLLPAIAMVAALIGIGMHVVREPKAWIALPILAASLVVLGVALRRRRVSLAGETLTVAAGLNTHRIASDELELATARILDLREHREYKPMLKVFGTRLPGLSTGHFRLRDRSRAFVLLTDPAKVLMMNERSGRRLLLSLERPQALLDALQAAQRR